MVAESWWDEQPYPSSALPPVILDAVRIVCARTGIAPSVAASSALLAAAIVAQGNARVQHPAFSSWALPASLFFLIVGERGVPDKMFCDWLFARHLRESGVLLVNDTPKLLAKRLAERKQYLAGLTAWHPFIFGGFRPRARLALSALTGFIRFWDESGFVGVPGCTNGAYISMGLHVPPSVLARVSHSRAVCVSLSASRFLGRCLVTVGCESHWLSDAPGALLGEPGLCAFQDRVRRLLSDSPVARGESLGGERVICLRPDALKRWVAFHNDCERKLETTFAPIRDFGVRAAEHALRLAAVLTVFERGVGDVTLDAVDSACQIVQWYAANALLLHDMLTVGRTRAKVRKRNVSAVAL